MFSTCHHAMASLRVASVIFLLAAESKYDYIMLCNPSHATYWLDGLGNSHENHHSWRDRLVQHFCQYMASNVMN
jgi:hypothetical protein